MATGFKKEYAELLKGFCFLRPMTIVKITYLVINLAHLSLRPDFNGVPVKNLRFMEKVRQKDFLRKISIMTKLTNNSPKK